MLFQLVVESKSFSTQNAQEENWFIRMLCQLFIYSKSYHFPHKMHRRRRMGSTCWSFTKKLALKVWFWFANLSLPWVPGKERCTRTLNGVLSTLSPPDPLGRFGCTHCQESLILFLCCGDNIFLIYICTKFNMQHCNVQYIVLKKYFVGKPLSQSTPDCLMLLKAISDHQPITC